MSRKSGGMPGHQRGRHQHPGQDVTARVDKLLAAGRITADEAAAIRRAVEAGDDLETAVRAVRLRHAREWVTTAVAQGRLTQADADEALARLEAGEDPSVLRDLRRRRA